ncbi:MAG TPA: hypothetical protein VNS50_09680 [Ginsengibacter sp.]|nr:hypothetical protein [Ginsengibacter sp.]
MESLISMLTFHVATRYYVISMQMDSTHADDNNVTVLHAKGTIRMGRSMKRFEDKPDITQTDIDAGKGIESREYDS